MVRAGTVAAAAFAGMALAVIALLMGVFAAMPSNARTAHSCGHLLDPEYRHGRPRPGCAAPLHERRIVVAGTAGVAGVTAIIGVAATARALRSAS